MAKISGLKLAFRLFMLRSWHMGTTPALTACRILGRISPWR